MRVCVAVSNRVVSFCLRWSNDETERKVVLPALHSRKEKETVNSALFGRGLPLSREKTWISWVIPRWSGKSRGEVWEEL